MSRDSLKTLAGLVVILLVIGGAFWYGSSQRQAQVSQVTPTPSVHQAATATPKPTVKATATSQPAATSKVTPAATPAPVAAAPLPRTGAATDFLPAAALAVAWVAYRRSRLRLQLQR